MTAIELIAEKHRTNREHKGYTPEHDDTHTSGELIEAASCYLDIALVQDHIGVSPEHLEQPPLWPFESDAWKPSDDPIRNLVHAGALIVAEIERLQRKSLQTESL
jgi:hypothetical protein